MSETQQNAKKKNRVRERLSSIWHNIKFWLDEVYNAKGLAQGAALAVGVSLVLISAVIGIDVKSGIGRIWDILISALLASIGFLLFHLILKWVFSFISPSLAKIAATFVAGWVFWVNLTDLKDRLVVWPMAILVVILIVFGASISYILGAGWKQGEKWGKVLSSFELFSSLTLLGLFIYCLAYPGTDTHILEIDPFQGESLIAAQNPSKPGPYEVLRLSYGSGTDLRREEYGEHVDLISKTVNASTFVYNPSPSLQDFKDWFANFPDEDFPLEDWIESKLRFWYWGFNRSAYPLNAQVWYPEGVGPFPLVLMVHGNHDMTEYSEYGYAYLGELLASRGYIFVSVDENFLNGYFAGGISGENDARGWLLLKHLELWDSWRKLPVNPFFEKVDMERIALIGHSRGGEAVSVAAAFNDIERYPDNGKVMLNFDFNIRSVIAIAPVDQQYQPSDRPVPLEDINYLVIQGAHDGDVSSFTGLRQYQRVKFTDPNSSYFKAALYIYQANHSQFNDDWGRHDLSYPRALLLNTKPIMPKSEQQQIAAVYISAFLDVSLKGNDEYRLMFEDYRFAGNWLPKSLYINQFQSAAFQPLATFEEDGGLVTPSISGGRVEIHALSRWQEVALEFRAGKEQDNQVLELTWSGAGGSYQLFLPENYSQDNALSANSMLQFNLADARDNPEDLLDIAVAVVDNQGRVASLPISDFASILPSFRVKFTKYEPWEIDKYENSNEIILQTYRIPLSSFLTARPEFDLANITQIRFMMDQTPKGKVFIDEIGFDE